MLASKGNAQPSWLAHPDPFGNPLYAGFHPIMDQMGQMNLNWPSGDAIPQPVAGTLFYVYILIIFVYILLNLLFSMGMRTPYSRWFDLILNFLRDVSEPYLRLFRRFIPPIGMFDLSPMIAIIVLYILRAVVNSLIAG